MLTHRQIRYFLAATDTGQVSAAARSLNVSQSAVTLAIQDMEAHLGAALFERRPSGLRLTRAGQRFRPHAVEIAASFAAADSSVAAPDTAVSGPVRLGMSWTLSSYFAFPVLDRFTRQHPQVDIQLAEEPREALEEALIEGTLDIALVLTSNLTERIGLASRTLSRSPRRLWMSVDHPLGEKKSVSLGDVADFPYAVLLSDDAEKQGLAYWADPDSRPAVKLASTSIEAVRSLVATGQALTILSDVVYRPWTLDGRRVERVDLAETVPTMDIGLAWKAVRPLSPAATALRDAFAQSIPLM